MESKTDLDEGPEGIYEWSRTKFSALRGNPYQEYGYSVINQCGTQVRIPERITPFERGVLHLVKSTQVLFDQHGDEYSIIFYPEPVGKPNSFPQLEVRFQGNTIITLTLKPGKSENVFHWEHDNYRIPLEGPHPLFEFVGTATGLAMWIVFISGYCIWGPDKEAIFTSKTYQHFMGLHSDDFSGDLELLDSGASFISNNIFGYHGELSDALQALDDQMQGPDPEDECINDGSCRLPCSRCDEEAHRLGTCRKECCVEKV